MIHANSLETYQAILSKLPERRAAVFSVIRDCGPITCQEIADLMGKPINEVSGRITELKKDDLILVCGKAFSNTHKPRALLRVVPREPEQGVLAL